MPNIIIRVVVEFQRNNATSKSGFLVDLHHSQAEVERASQEHNAVDFLDHKS